MSEQEEDPAQLDSARRRARRRKQGRQTADQQQAFFSGGTMEQQQQQQQQQPIGGPPEPTSLHRVHRPVARRPIIVIAPLELPTPIRQNSWHLGVARSSNYRTAGGRKMKSVSSLERKYKKPSWYHQVAAKNRLGAIHEDAFVPETQEADEATPAVPVGTQQAKEELLQELNRTEGESNTPAFQAALQKLVQHYDASHFNPRKPVPRYARACAGNQLEGIGIAAGTPSFAGCIGRNQKGDPMYKLGTMSFGMFCPTQLVVSVQGTFVLIDTVDGRNPRGVKNVPKELLADVRFGTSPVRTYDIVTPLTIEAWRPEFGEDSPNKGIDQPIRGVLTSYGFILPYPTQNRFSVWFTGGSLEVDDHKNEKWFQIFDKDAVPKRTPAESDKLLKAKKLLGASNNNDEMDQDGKLIYSLSNPQFSHIDLLYLDKTLQVLRGSSGTVYVHVRLPGSGAVRDSVRSRELLPAPLDPLTGNFIRKVSSTSNLQELMRMMQEQPEVVSDVTPDARLLELESFVVPNDDTTDDDTSTTESTSNLQQSLLQLQPTPEPPEVVSDVAPDSRLQELDSFVVPEDESPKRSCLKKTSSYGGLEELGTNIPIRQERKAWMALPKPKSLTEKKASPRRKRSSRVLKGLRRRHSGTSLEALENKSKVEDPTECNSTDSGEDLKQNTKNAADSKQSRMRKCVSFTSLEIRSYNLTVGDNPSCAAGPPVSLDWTYGPYTRKIPLSDNVENKSSTLFRMNPMERTEMLRTEFGVGMSDIMSAQVEARRVKQQRSFTKRRSTPRNMKVEETLESIQRTAKRAVTGFRKPKSHAKNDVAGVA